MSNNCNFWGIANLFWGADTVMDDALLPIEGCENMIDRCYYRLCSTTSFEDTYETLRSCALVCSVWFPRSRRNLLREVSLGSVDRVDLLLRLLTDSPHLAELVTTVCVNGDKYVPFASFPLPRLLPNCRRLVIPDARWGTRYRPGYSRSISLLRANGTSAQH